MEFFVILTAWLLLQWLGPSSALHRDHWLHHWYLRAGSALSAMPLAPRLLLVCLLPALAVALLALLLEPVLGGVPLFLLQLLVLTYALGRGDFNAQLDAYLARWQRGDLEAAYREALRAGVVTDSDSMSIGDGVALHREMRAAIAYSGFERWFAVVLWFYLLGPAAALFYRTLQLLLRDGCVSGEERRLIARWLLWIEWLPARLLGLAFAVTGNFVTCFRCWREHFLALVPTRALLAAYAERALGGANDAAADGQALVVAGAVELNELRDLLRRSAICWLVALALLQLVG
jgi:AmpE protein